MKRKTLALLLALCLALALLPTAALADAGDVTSVTVAIDMPKVGGTLDDFIEVTMTPNKPEKEALFVIEAWDYFDDKGEMVPVEYEDLATFICKPGVDYHLHLGLVLRDGSKFACEPKDVTINGAAQGSNGVVWFPEQDMSVMSIDMTITRFADVSYMDYFNTPVMWAVGNGVTDGTSDTTFSPARTCTQAQILTFLYRAAGSPETSIENPYQNAAVAEGQYFYKAMLWAYEKGVVTDKTLSPTAECLRSDVAAYLWRLKGSPEAKDAGFTDVPAGSAYEKAVNWAVESGITDGTGDKVFSHAKPCTRAQIVTFLWRYFVELEGK